MTKAIVHVNKNLIGWNRTRKPEHHVPVYTIKTGNKNYYAYSVEIDGPSKLIDMRENKQLSCGARAWIECDWADIIPTALFSWSDVQLMKERAKL